MKQVCKKSSIQGDHLSPNANNNKILNVQQRLTEMQEDISQESELIVCVNKSRLFDDKDEVTMLQIASHP